MRIGKDKGKTMYYAASVSQDKITTKQGKAVSSKPLPSLVPMCAVPSPPWRRLCAKRCLPEEALTLPTSAHSR